MTIHEAYEIYRRITCEYEELPALLNVSDSG